jgi:hypothetical protein
MMVVVGFIGIKLNSIGIAMNGDAVRKKSNGPRRLFQNLTATELFQIGAAVAVDNDGFGFQRGCRVIISTTDKKSHGLFTKIFQSKKMKHHRDGGPFQPPKSSNVT